MKVHVVERSRVADAFDTIHLNEAVDEISLSSPLPQEPPEFPHDVEAESLNDGEEPSSDENSIPPPVTTPRPALWLGNVLRTGFGASYLHERDKLADAAYWGDWDTVLENLETGQQLYDESWSNAARLSKLSRMALVIDSC